jgi:hypothetical protein
MEFDLNAEFCIVAFSFFAGASIEKFSDFDRLFGCICPRFV